MAAGGNQAVVLVDGGLYAFERVGNPVAGLDFDRHLPSLITNHHMVLEENGSVLRDRLQLFTQRCKSNASYRKGVAHSDDVRMLFMHRRMQDKSGSVYGMPAFNHPAAVVGEDKVGHPDLRKMYRHGVGPVPARIFRVTLGQVTGKAVIEAVQGKRAACGHQTLLAMLPLPRGIGKRNQHRENKSRLLKLINRNALIASWYQSRFFKNGRHKITLLVATAMACS